MTDARTDAEYGTIDRNGRGLRWKRVGTGPPVVLEIGAGAGGVDYWGPLETDLARTNAVITYDRAGMGGSDPIPGGPTLASWTADLHAVVTEVAGGRAVVAGWSLGGLIALGFAFEHPGSAAGLVLIDTTEDRHGWLQVAVYRYLNRLTMPAMTWTHAFRTRTESGKAKARQRSVALVNKVAPALSDEEKDRLVEYFAVGGHYRGTAAEVPSVSGAVADFNRLRDQGGTPDVPVVVLSATKGPFRKKLWVVHQKLAASFPRGKFMLAEDCSHMIPFEKPEIAAAAVRDVLQASGGG